LPIFVEKSYAQYGAIMNLEYTYWKAKDGWFVGYLNIWPEHLTQGKDIPELEEMLADLYEFYKEEQEEQKVEKRTGVLQVTV
jgi:predicted RNase H-like HicB family nuclease